MRTLFAIFLATGILTAPCSALADTGWDVFTPFPATRILWQNTADSGIRRWSLSKPAPGLSVAWEVESSTSSGRKSDTKSGTLRLTTPSSCVDVELLYKDRSGRIERLKHHPSHLFVDESSPDPVGIDESFDVWLEKKVILGVEPVDSQFIEMCREHERSCAAGRSSIVLGSYCDPSRDRLTRCLKVEEEQRRTWESMRKERVNTEQCVGIVQFGFDRMSINAKTSGEWGAVDGPGSLGRDWVGGIVFTIPALVLDLVMLPLQATWWLVVAPAVLLR